MRCPHCNAEVQGTHCSYCGSELPKKATQKAGCPKCSSTNVSFTREKQGEVRGTNSKHTIHRTVGLCKDCGHTWYTDTTAPQTQAQPTSKKKTWLWVLGWICIFPLPLTILLLRKKEMNPKVKYGVIIAAWIVYLIIGLTGNTDDTANNTPTAPDTTIEDTSSSTNNKVPDTTTDTTGNVTTEDTNTTAGTEEPINEFAVVDTFIEKYNAVAVNQISDITEMDIQGDDYRTEFRLNAFKTAIGKKGVITGGNIDIVNYGTWSNDTIRVYVTTDTLDNAIDIYTTLIHILDGSITDEDIADSYSSLDSVSSANIYLGSSGYISGYINTNYANGGVSGYEIMIDCDKLNFMD